MKVIDLGLPMSYYGPKKQIKVNLSVDLLEWCDKHLVNKNRNTFIELSIRYFISKLEGSEDANR